MMKNNTYSKQERMTFNDTKYKQEQMREYLQEKIKHPVVIEQDKKVLPGVVADALLSQPALSGLKPVIEVNDIKVLLASNVYDFLLKLLDVRSYVKHDGKRYTKFTLRGKIHEIEMSRLWRRLLDYCNQLSAAALAEGIGRSKEKEIHKTIGVKNFSDDSEDEESEF